MLFFINLLNTGKEWTTGIPLGKKDLKIFQNLCYRLSVSLLHPYPGGPDPLMSGATFLPIVRILPCPNLFADRQLTTFDPLLKPESPCDFFMPF